MVDKVRGIALRESGMSYAEIATTLGCSVAWCRLYLKGVDKGIREQPDGEIIRQKIIAIVEEALMKIREI